MRRQVLWQLAKAAYSLIMGVVTGYLCIANFVMNTADLWLILVLGFASFIFIASFINKSLKK